jgi:hypothetical protein
MESATSMDLRRCLASQGWGVCWELEYSIMERFKTSNSKKRKDAASTTTQFERPVWDC